MTPNEFIELVRDMRAVQRRYFATRDIRLLHESKVIELQVDNWLKDRGQMKMFEEKP